MHNISFCRASKRLLHYGVYAVLCHATLIFLMAKTSQYPQGVILFHRFFPMIEHSLISFVAILFGVLGVEYIEKGKK